MKTNLTKMMSAGALAMLMAVSGGTMVFAANSQMTKADNAAAREAAVDSRIEKDTSKNIFAKVEEDNGTKLAPEGDNIVADTKLVVDETVGASFDYENNPALEKDNPVKADTGAKLTPNSDNLVNDSTNK